MEQHPDHGGCTTEFTKIHAAYELLSDKDRKELYDVQAFREKSAQRPARKTPSRHVTATYTLEGQTLKVKLRGCPTRCPKCQGEGTADPSAKQICDLCENQQPNKNPPCFRCQGFGFLIEPQKLCRWCRGEGYMREGPIAYVEVPLSFRVFPGHTVVLEGRGGCLPNHRPGDVVVRYVEAPHGTFQRRGHDLLMRHKISFLESLQGGYDFGVDHPDGRRLRVTGTTSPLGPTEAGGILRVPGWGQPGCGDLYIVLSVILPELSSTAAKAVAQCLQDGRRDVASTYSAPAVSVIAERLVGETEDSLKARLDWGWRTDEEGVILGKDMSPNVERIPLHRRKV